MVPTKRPRLLVTETDELAAALDQAAERWPELSRSRLLARLATEGQRAVEDDAAAERRLAAVRASAGVLAGAWPAHARDRLRDEWPE
jgi:hypothetical protein